VKDFRKEQPRSGGKKALYYIRPILKNQNLDIGRDRFFNVLRSNRMLIKRRNKVPRTTYSRHSYAVQPNLLANMKPTLPKQVFVADITYLRMGDSLAYLFLITDAVSRKIVGHHVATNLSHKGAIKALQIAAKSLGDLTGVIHHTDRGCQYCCHEYIQALQKLGMRSSMTDKDHCAQNALAERMNGILKDEYFLDLPFPNLYALTKAVENSITIYNTKRPHWSLNFKTPDEVYGNYMRQQAA
jgi:transposase InsO family protein